ncbi:hypothetical protein D3C76_1583090 [compost metagenome]
MRPMPVIPIAKTGQISGIIRPNRPITKRVAIGTKRVPPKNARASGRRILWKRSCSIQMITPAMTAPRIPVSMD